MCLQKFTKPSAVLEVIYHLDVKRSIFPGGIYNEQSLRRIVQKHLSDRKSFRCEGTHYLVIVKKT